MIFKYYGKDVDREAIVSGSGQGRAGASLLGLSEIAERFGFKTTSAKLTYDQLLTDVPLPCILYWDRYHFVVLTPASTKKKLVVADPAKGLLTYSRQEFLDFWTSTNEEGADKGIALLLTPASGFYQAQGDGKKGVDWSLLSRYILKYKRQVFQLALGLLVGSLLQLAFPYLTQSIVDTGINTHNLQFIHIILVAQFMLFFAQTFIEFIRSRILLFVSTHVNLAILSDFWIKLLKLPLNFFETRSTGDILQRIGDHRRIENFITGTALQTLFSLLNLLVFSVVLLTYSSSVFLIFIAGSVAYFMWIMIFLSYRRTLDFKRFDVASKENSVTMQIVSGINEIKLNNAEHLKRWQWEGIQARLFKLNFKSLALSQYQQAGGFFLNHGKNILITYVVARAVLDGELTLGAMLAIQFIIGQLNGPVEQLISFSQQAQDAKISLERLNQVHRLQEEEPPGLLFSESIPDHHDIEFRRLSFAYPGAGSPTVLTDINFTVPAGKVTAIVGESGSGKTTLLKLIQLLYSGYSGDILVGGSNLRYLRPSYWRSLCGSVMQDGFIFSETIAQNIAVGDENPDYLKLMEACKVANIMGFVESLPLGLNTKIGVEGVGLSTGQRQRILIARAVYKDPKFIFFDEATNALDANNERSIMENMERFFKGRTVVVVAHRLSTVMSADNIIVLEKGKIVEQGVHEELTRNGDRYYQLIRKQLELGS